MPPKLSNLTLPLLLTACAPQKQDPNFEDLSSVVDTGHSWEEAQAPEPTDLTLSIREALSLCDITDMDCTGGSTTICEEAKLASAVLVNQWEAEGLERLHFQFQYNFYPETQVRPCGYGRNHFDDEWIYELYDPQGNGCHVVLRRELLPTSSESFIRTEIITPYSEYDHVRCESEYDSHGTALAWVMNHMITAMSPALDQCSEDDMTECELLIEVE